MQQFAYEYRRKLILDKWRNINATLRWPTSDAWDAPSQQSVMLSAFETQKRALHDQVDLSFRASTINEFSKSMETAHGWVHGIIGGGWQPDTFTGQMWPLEYSAFEPLFMLHHTCVYFPIRPILLVQICTVLLIGLSNVDRLFSMYQTTHPERVLNPENIGPNGNVFLEDNQIVDGDTQLLPFRKPDGNGFWTTNDVHDTRVFGYAYPETSTGHSAGAAIANLYSSSARALIKSTNIKIHTKQAVASENAGALSYASDNTYTDYLIHGSTKTALSTFSATFYFVPTFSPGRDLVEVGSWVNVIMQRPQQELMHANGTISLTSALMDRIANGELESLDTQDVVPYLAAYLVWQIRDVRILSNYYDVLY
jgi:tyrosinase